MNDNFINANIKDLIVSSVDKKKMDLARDILESMEDYQILSLVSDSIINYRHDNSDFMFKNFLSNNLFNDFNSDMIAIELLIKLFRNPKLVFEVYYDGLKNMKDNNINESYIKSIDSSLVKKLFGLSKKYSKYNAYLVDQMSDFLEVEDAISSDLYKLSIQFKDEHNYNVHHSIFFLKKDGIYTGTLFGCPVNAYLDELNCLVVNISMDDDVITLVCNLSNNKVDEYVNDLKTTSIAEAYLVKVSNDKLKLTVLRDNLKAIHESNPNTLLKTL